MRTIPLRQLLREPVKVKKITRNGDPVQITDNGRPLWVIQSAVVPDKSERRKQEIEAELAEVLRGVRAKPSLTQIVLESRR